MYNMQTNAKFLYSSTISVVLYLVNEFFFITIHGIFHYLLDQFKYVLYRTQNFAFVVLLYHSLEGDLSVPPCFWWLTQSGATGETFYHLHSTFWLNPYVVRFRYFVPRISM